MRFLTRITFNSSNWELLSSTVEKYLGPKLFEAIHGFGFEEWLGNDNIRLEKNGTMIDPRTNNFKLISL